METYTAGLVCPDCAENDTELLRKHNATVDYDNETGEGFHEFVKSPCYACGDKLYGSRYTVAFWHEGGN